MRVVRLSVAGNDYRSTVSFFVEIRSPFFARRGGQVFGQVNERLFSTSVRKPVPEGFGLLLSAVFARLYLLPTKSNEPTGMRLVSDVARLRASTSFIASFTSWA